MDTFQKMDGDIHSMPIEFTDSSDGEGDKNEEFCSNKRKRIAISPSEGGNDGKESIFTDIVEDNSDRVYDNSVYKYIKYTFRGKPVQYIQQEPIAFH